MMNFNLVKIKKAIEKFRTKINQEIMASLLALVIFLYIFYSVFFGLELNEFEISEYLKPFKDNYREYDDSVNNAGANVKNLVEDSQVEDLEYYDELIDEKSYNKREDPFTELP